MSVDDIISRTEKGGEVVEKDDQGIFYNWNDLSGEYKKGDTKALVEITTHSCTLMHSFTYTAIKELKPAIRNGKETVLHEPSYKVDVGFPCELNGIHGYVDLFVYVKEGDYIPGVILKEIGNALLSLKLKDKD